jgi:hypothetical protein
VIVISLATLATATLVILLSLRLRRREITTMVRIGGERSRVVGVLATEIGFVLALGVLLAAVLTALTAAYGSQLIRSIILS